MEGTSFYKELEQKNEDLRVLIRLIEVVHKSSGLEEVYRVALDSVMELENVDMTAIYLVDEEKHEAVLKAYRNLTADYVRRADRIPYPKGVTWKLINSGTILNIEDVQKDPDIGPAGRDIGPHSCLGIPILLEEKVIGVIWFASYKECKFNEREVTLLSTLGNQIGIAIAKAKREETLKKSLAQLSKKSKYEAIISTVTKSVHQSINLQEVMENAIKSMSKNMDKVQHVSIYLVEGDEAVIKAHRGYPEWFVERIRKIPYPKGAIWKTVIIEGKTRYVADTEEDTVIEPAGREIGTKSYLCMPIHFEGKAIGTIIINSLRKDDFDEEELKLLEIVVGQIEVAIGNAGQAEALRKARDELETRVRERTGGLESVNKTLKESEEKFRVLTETANDAIISADSLGNITYFNKGAEHIWGYSATELVGKPLTILMAERFHNAYKEGLKHFLSTGETRLIGKTIELAGKRKDGSEFPLELSLATWKTNEETFFTGILRDITERKKTEEQIRASLREKEALLREIRHRVKNNLQVISSLLSLQSGYVRSKEAVKAFKECQNRIKSIALVHERMLEMTSINFNEHIQELAATLFHSYVIDPDRITLKIYGSDNSLDVDTAIPCSLIVNELLSNSLKHAFPGDRKGEVYVDIHRGDNEGYILTIGDNGIGFPKELDFRNTESLGLQLVNMLVNQIEGTIEIHSSQGVEFRITF